MSAAPSAFGVSPQAIIVCSNGADTPTRCLSTFRDSETEIPDFTSAAASRRFSAVIRLRAPNSSSFPHLPQLESASNHSAIVSRVAPTRGKLESEKFFASTIRLVTPFDLRNSNIEIHENISLQELRTGENFRPNSRSIFRVCYFVGTASNNSNSELSTDSRRSGRPWLASSRPLSTVCVRRLSIVTL